MSYRSSKEAFGDLAYTPCIFETTAHNPLLHKIRIFENLISPTFPTVIFDWRSIVNNKKKDFFLCKIKILKAYDSKYVSGMAGPVGFEPTISGSEGRHLNPC
jgi:hypothetical protein